MRPTRLEVTGFGSFREQTTVDFTEADLFARWFGADLDVEITEWDLTEGGGGKAVMTYEGNAINWAGRFVENDEPSRLAVRITDEGSGFDPDALPDPTLPHNRTRARGRGVFLIHQLMDEVEFNEQGNSIDMVLKAQSAGDDRQAFS